MTKPRVSQSTAPLPKWRPRRTLIDLYNEKDLTAWYWRAAATIAAFLISIGFLIFPTAFNNTSNLSVSSGITGVTAAVLLALGYTLSIALWLVVRSWMFQLEAIFAPCLSSSLFGLFNVVYSLSTHKIPDGESQWNTAYTTALVLATLSSLVYTILTLLTFRKIHIVRARDGMHRYRSSSDSGNFMPEDEMQRRQLLQLLSQKEGRKLSPEASQSTFRIDLPDGLRRQGTHLLVPQSIYESSREHTRSRSASDVPQIDRTHWGPGNGGINGLAQQQPQSHGGDLYISQSIIPAQTSQTLAQVPLAQLSPSHNNSNFLPPQSYTNHARHRSDSTTSSNDDLDTRYPPEKASLPPRPRHPLSRGPSSKSRPFVARPPPSPKLTPNPNQQQQQHRLSSRSQHNEYQIIPPEEAEEIIRRASRESRRAEIEMENRPSSRQELEGVEVSPRIKRVDTDGWGRRLMGG